MGEIARFSPETRPNTYFKIPTRKGTYIKLKDCSPFKGVTDPYWTCRTLGRGVKPKNTEVGLQSNPKSKRYYWDYSKDPSKMGYGLFFPNDRSKCVVCKLKDRRIFKDKSYINTLEVCRGSHTKWQRVAVKVRGKATKQTCSVLYKHNR